MVVEVGPEHPELVVADDPPVGLLGLHERGRSRKAIAPFFQLVTLRVFCLTPEWVLSIRLVEPRHFLSRGGRPSRLIVNISLRPSRRLAEAEGWSRSSHRASCSSFCSPCFASSFIAARNAAFT